MASAAGTPVDQASPRLNFGGVIIHRPDHHRSRRPSSSAAPRLTSSRASDQRLSKEGLRTAGSVSRSAGKTAR